MEHYYLPIPIKGYVEELLSFVPEYYRHIKEYVAIQKAIAPYIEALFEAFELSAADSNIMTASEPIIAFFEQVIGLKYNGRRELEDRRKLLLLYYNLIGHVSATKIKQLVAYYTGAKYVDVSFNGKDDRNNYLLEIGCDRTSIKDDVFLEDLDLLFRKIIPAHLFLGVAFYYEHSIVIRFDSKENYLFEYERCGTKPKMAMVADINEPIAVQVETHKENYRYDYLMTGTRRAGTEPSNAMVYDDTNTVSAEATSDRQTILYDAPPCGVFSAGDL